MSAEDKAETTSSTLHFVAKKDEIIQAGRVTKFVNGREGVGAPP